MESTCFELLEKHTTNCTNIKSTRKYTNEQLTTLRKKAMILRNQLIKNNPDRDNGDLTREAWVKVKEENELLHMVEATTKSGKRMSRVVYTNWTAYNEVKGTGKPKPAGLILLVDVAKHMSRKPSTISVYEQNIISLAA